MASGWTVATTFTARGNLGRELRSLRGEFGSLGRTAGKAKRFVGGMMTGAAIGGAAALAYGVREVKNEYVDLDQAVTNAASKWGEAFDRGTQGFNDLMEAAKRVGLTTEHRSAQAASGLNFLAMAGFSAEESLALLPGVANLATAANLDFAQSTDIASDSLGAFGMATGSSEQKASGFRKIMEQVAMTTNKTNTDILQWFEAVKQGAPTFTTAGQSLSTFNAAVGLLANNGIKGEKAGTALRGVMATLSKESGKSYKTLKKLGVSVQDDAGNFRDFADILDDLNKSTADLGSAERTSVLEKIFGKRQMSQMAILMKEGATRFRELRSEIESSAGADVKLASKMRKSIANSFKLVQSALVGKGIDIIQELFGGEDPAEALTKMAEAIQDFDTGPMVDSLREAIRVLKESGELLYDNKEMIVGLGKAFLAFKVASFVADFGRGTAAMLNFGKTSSKVTKGVSGDFSRMGRNIQGVMSLVGALIAMYQTLKFASGGIEEAQEAKLEGERQKAAYDRQMSKADITGWSDKGLKRSIELNQEFLKDAESRGRDDEKSVKEQVVLLNRISSMRAELSRREGVRNQGVKRQRQEYAAAVSGRGQRMSSEEWQGWEGNKQSGGPFITDNTTVPLPATPHTKRTETRTESVERYEVDWGEPPPGVTVRNRQGIAVGGMP